MAAVSLPKLTPENDALISRFTDYLTVEKGLSPLTIEAYRCDLTQLAQFLGSRPLLAARREDMSDYVRKLLSAMKARSVCRKILTFRGLYKFLLIDGRISADPMRAIRLPKDWETLPRCLTSPEINTFLMIPLKADYWALRDLAMLELLYGAALRASEIASARLTDLDFSERHITVCGKGNRERIAPFGHRAAQAITQYLEKRRQDAEVLQARLEKQEHSPLFWQSVSREHRKLRARYERALSPWLFCGNDGQHLTRCRVWQIVRSRFKQAGLGDVHPHTLRHSCATHMVENGADLRTVQTILGHALVETTAIYTHVNAIHLQKAYQCHPRVSGKHNQTKLQFNPALALVTGVRMCENCLHPAVAGKTRCELHLRLAAEAVTLCLSKPCS